MIFLNAWKYKNGDWVLNENVNEDAELIQCLEHLILIRAGEWFLNEAYGFRREVIEVKKVNSKELIQAFRDALYQEPRVAEVITVSYAFDRVKRLLKVNFRVRTKDKELGGEVDVDI